VWTVVLSLSLLWAVEPLIAQAAESDPPEPVSLDIIGSPEASGPMSSWTVAMMTAPGSPTVSSFAVGDLQARRRLIDGTADVIVTAVPFSAEESAELEATGRQVVAAPMQGVGMVPITSGPFPSGIDLCTWVEQPEDEDPGNEFPPDCLDPRDYVGSLRLSSKDLADVFLQRSDRLWESPEVVSWLTGNDPTVGLVPIPRQASPVTRSDPGMPNLALQTYLSRTQPALWTQAFSARFPPLPEVGPGETWVFPGAPGRNMLSEAVGIVRLWQTAAGSSGEPARGGAIAMSTPLEAFAALQAEAEEPEFDLNGNRNVRTELYIAQMRNGAGEWLDVTPQAITTALAAADGTFLRAATENVPGAWPMSWVNTMYVPTSGLTGGEANAIAAVIRWQSTVGREGAAIIGDGQLPDAMVREALAAADAVVESNCDAAGLDTVETADPSDYAPAGSLTELGELVWCDVPVAASAVTSTTSPGDRAANGTATAATGSSGGPSGVGSGSSSGSSSSGGGSSSLAPIRAAATASADAAATGAGSGAGVSAEVAERELDAARISYTMPLALPGPDPYDFDRLATLALGGVLFLMGRWLFRRTGLVSA